MKIPRAYRLDHPDVVRVDAGEEARDIRGRIVVAAEPEEAGGDVVPAPLAPVSRRPPWLGLLLSALGGLALLGIGLWAERVVVDLMARYPALGWTAAGLAGLALLAFVALLLRETLGILRERKIERLRERTLMALTAKDDRAARAVVADLVALYAARPETAHARQVIDDLGEAIIDGPDRLAIAERALMGPLDGAAKVAVARAAKQVSLVTAISPRAIVDVAFVLYVAFRLIRRLAAIYGGRPGFFGFMRLARNVLAHLALTGGMAAGDSLIQQVLGLGVAARVSAKLGEGVLNGLLTARVGLAAIAVCRPMPFAALDQPAIGDVAGNLIERKDDR